jgi:transposase InsO family protein
MLASLHHFQQDEIAQERLKIIQFYETYGAAATKEAFGVSRQVICTWKKRLAKARGHLQALTPQSTRPKHTRSMQTDWRLVQFIRQLRDEHPGLGKEKIKPLLDAYCREQGLPPISVSTIGKVIHRRQLTRHTRTKAKNRRKTRHLRERLRYAPKATDLGHLQLDTLERVYEGVKLYFYSAIDLQSKFGFSLPYARCTSHNAVDFFDKVRQIFPVQPIRLVQSDNGSEFVGEFEAHLRTLELKQVFSYPRCPKINGCIERYQRTLQEEFVDVYEDLFFDLPRLHRQLADYLVFYNCQRVHHALDLQTPMQFLVAQKAMSKMSVTYTFS